MSKRDVLWWGSFFVILFHALVQQTLAQAPFREDPEKVLGFANSLYKEQDYYRAISEYRAFLFLFPGNPKGAEARFFLAKAHQALGHWSDALKGFETLTKSQPISIPWSAEAALEAGKTLIMAGRPLLAARRLKRLAALPQWMEIRTRALLLAARAYLGARRWDKAIELLEEIGPGDPLSSEGLDLKEAIRKELRSSRKKNPLVARGLSALLPGLGHLYVGRPKEAVVSFLLNSASIAGAVWAIEEGYYVTGGILSFMEIGWYIGGISSAAQYAKDHNLQVERKWLRTIDRRFGF